MELRLYFTPTFGACKEFRGNFKNMAALVAYIAPSCLRTLNTDGWTAYDDTFCYDFWISNSKVRANKQYRVDASF